MKSGSPVVASDIPVHREIYANAAEYFNPYSADALSHAIQAVIDPIKTTRRVELVAKGAIVARSATRMKRSCRNGRVFCRPARWLRHDTPARRYGDGFRMGRVGSSRPLLRSLTHSKFRRATLDELSRQEFFESGESHVQRVFTTIRRYINPEFAPKTILDFGWRGRAIDPLVRR